MTALKLAKRKLKNLTIINPYDILEEEGMKIEHADENETSLLWACYPKEEIKSLRMTIAKNDDYFGFIGYDPRKKASLKFGKRMLQNIVAKLVKRINIG